MQEASEPWILQKYLGGVTSMSDPSHLKGAEARDIYDNWKKREALGKPILEFNTMHKPDIRHS
jgi:hypothetical protein